MKYHTPFSSKRVHSEVASPSAPKYLQALEQDMLLFGRGLFLFREASSSGSHEFACKLEPHVHAIGGGQEVNHSRIGILGGVGIHLGLHTAALLFC